MKTEDQFILQHFDLFEGLRKPSLLKIMNALSISAVFILIISGCSPGTDTKSGISNEELKEAEASAQGDSWQQILAGKEPLSKEDLYKLFPEALGDMPRIGITDNPGTNGAIGTYSQEKETSHLTRHITLKIIDGAGYSGFQHINAVHRMIESNYSEENSNGWSRIEQRNNQKMIVQQKVSGEKLNSGVSFIKNQRYHITLEGSRLAAERLYSEAETIQGMNYPN
jgi:hypothetical protein